MKVQDVMTRDVRSCRLDSDLADVVKDIWEADCGVLPVVGPDSRVVGMITDRDICIAVATKGRTADRISVREVVHDHVHMCLSNDTTATALKTMQTHKVRRLPVVDADGHLEGIVSLNDIATHAGAATPAQIAHTLEGICERRVQIVTPSAA